MAAALLCRRHSIVKAVGKMPGQVMTPELNQPSAVNRYTSFWSRSPTKHVKCPTKINPRIMKYCAERSGSEGKKNHPVMAPADHISVFCKFVDISSVDVEADDRTDGYHLSRKGRGDCHESDQENGCSTSFTRNCHCRVW